jgi:hypothetical protein
MDCLEIVVAGIGHSAIKSLSIDIIGPTVKLVPARYPPSPSLKRLVVDGDGDEDHNDDDVIDALFVSLQHPGCGVEILEPRALRLGSPSGITSTQQANRNLRILELDGVYLSTHKSVSLLWQLVGLQELHVFVPQVDEDDDPDC